MGFDSDGNAMKRILWLLVACVTLVAAAALYFSVTPDSHLVVLNRDGDTLWVDTLWGADVDTVTYADTALYLKGTWKGLDTTAFARLAASNVFTGSPQVMPRESIVDGSGWSSSPLPALYVKAAGGRGAAWQKPSGGLADTTWVGDYYGLYASETVFVLIYKTGTPDSIKWKIKRSNSWSAAAAISGASQSLQVNAYGYGCAITFAATTGHTLNDTFFLAVSQSPTLVGQDATGDVLVDISPQQIALGRSHTVDGMAACAIGNLDVVSGSSAISVGNSATASGSQAITIGTGGTASGNFSVAVGYFAKASGLNAAAIGRDVVATGSSSFGTGRSDTASGVYSSAFGYGCNATDSCAKASGMNARALKWQDVYTNPAGTAMRITNVDSAGTQKGVTGLFSTSVAIAKASVTSGTALDVAGAAKFGSIILGDTWLVTGGGAAFNASTSFSVYNDSVSGVDTVQLSAMNRQGAFVAVYNRGAAAGDTVFVKNGATLLATLTAGQNYKGIYTGPSGGLSWRTW